MRAGLATSLVVHTAVLGFAVVSLASPKPLEVDDVEALPIELVSVEDITRAVEGDREASVEQPPAPKPTTAPPRPEPAQNVGNADSDRQADAPEPKPAPPVEQARSEPEPAPAPEPKPRPEPKPEAKAPEPKPEPDPEPQKTDLALLTKQAIEETQAEQKAEPEPKLPTRVVTPKRRPTPPKRVEKPKPKKPEPKETKTALLDKAEPSAGGAKRSERKAGLGTRRGNNAVKLSASEIDALRSQIQSCWNVGALAGSDDADTLRARVTFQLDRAGAIQGKPNVKVSGGTARTERTFGGSARRAVIRCAPYKLPADKYDTWGEVVVNFSLRDML